MSTSGPHPAAREELQAAAPAGAVCPCGLLGRAPPAAAAPPVAAALVALVARVAAAVVVALVARVVAAALVAAYSCCGQLAHREQTVA